MRIDPHNIWASILGKPCHHVANFFLVSGISPPFKEEDISADNYLGVTYSFFSDNIECESYRWQSAGEMAEMRLLTVDKPEVGR